MGEVSVLKHDLLAMEAVNHILLPGVLREEYLGVHQVFPPHFVHMLYLKDGGGKRVGRGVLVEVRVLELRLSDLEVGDGLETHRIGCCVSAAPSIGCLNAY